MCPLSLYCRFQTFQVVVGRRVDLGLSSVSRFRCIDLFSFVFRTKVINHLL
jgi:hypothetical protein